MSVEQTVTDQVTRAHGLEIDTQGVRPCSDIWFVHTGAKTSKDDTLANWLVNRLAGCGQVHLVQLKVHATGAAKESLYVGISAVGKTESAKNLAVTGRGFMLVPNAKNENELVTATIIPMGILSRQIQPPSSNQPMMRLVFEKTAGMTVTFEFQVEVPDVRIQDETLA